MSYQIMQWLWVVDTSRAEEIAHSLSPDDSFFLGISDGISKVWTSLTPRNAPECGWRGDCTGCERITKLATGRVLLVYENQKWNFDIRNPLGTICTTENQWYQRVFFSWIKS